MHKFDVKYTFDNYYEYYKFILVKQRALRDIIFSLLFVGIAIYWFIDTSDSTKGWLLPVLALVLAVACPLTSFIALPMLKKQLNAKKDDIDRTHIEITFTEDEVIYNNLTVKPELEQTSNEEKVEIENVEAKTETENVLDEKIEEKVENLENQEDEEEVVKETKEETPVVDSTEKEEKTETEFKLQYANFLSVKETKGLFLFYLDRQTVVIIPKETYLNGTDFTEFKEFIRSKINSKRIKFLKEKK